LIESFGFYAITMLPPRASFNTSWFIDGNLVLLVEKFVPAGWNAERRTLAVHIDNAHAHNLKMAQTFCGHNPLKNHQRLSDCPDISPSEFYLFGKVKRALVGGDPR
jgi:hypothetical protein